MPSSSALLKPRGSSTNCSSAQPPSTTTHSPGLDSAALCLIRSRASLCDVMPSMPVLGSAHVMRVVVDQPGDDGATIEVHHAREWPLVLLDLGVAANREDALALDRQRLGNRE